MHWRIEDTSRRQMKTPKMQTIDHPNRLVDLVPFLVSKRRYAGIYEMRNESANFAISEMLLSYSSTFQILTWTTKNFDFPFCLKSVLVHTSRPFLILWFSFAEISVFWNWKYCSFAYRLIFFHLRKWERYQQNRNECQMLLCDIVENINNKARQWCINFFCPYENNSNIVYS